MLSGLSQNRSVNYSAVKNVLLIDDSLDNIALTRRALARSGITVHLDVLQDKSAVLQRVLEQCRPVASLLDLVLINMGMSKMDGFELIKIIRSQPISSYIPIVAISSSAREEDVLHSYSCGASSYIFKSVDFTEYAQIIHGVCSYWLNINLSPQYTKSNPVSA